MALHVISTKAERQSDKGGIDLDFARRTSFFPDSVRQDDNTKQIFITNREQDLFLSYMAEETRIKQKSMKFCTGSKYLGQWNQLGMAGKGVYKFPHGVIYDGYFNRDGEFHGAGTLLYPNGQRIEGIWRNGKLGDSNTFVTSGGVVMNDDYCTMPDRRFQIELENDLKPANQEYLTNQEPPQREIPDKCYDLVDGYYDPGIKTVYKYPKSNTQPIEQKVDTKSFTEGSYASQKAKTKVPKPKASSHESLPLYQLLETEGSEERREILWIPSSEKEMWITKNCRKAWDENTGYRPDLYEIWTKGGTSVENEIPEHKIINVETLQLSLSHSKRKEKSSLVDSEKEAFNLTQMFMNINSR